MKIRKPTQNLIVDVAAFAAFLLMLGTGFLLRYVLPPGSGSAAGSHGGGASREFLTVWGLTRHEWGAVHFWVSIALLAILALHLILHWQWIVSMVRGRPSEASGKRVAVGMAATAALVLLAAAPLLSPVERQVREGDGRQQGLEVGAVDSLAVPTVATGAAERDSAGEANPQTAERPAGGQARANPQSRQGENDIRGQTTLARLAEACGMTHAEVTAKLSIPESTEPSSTLGQLQRRYPFTLADARALCR